MKNKVLLCTLALLLASPPARAVINYATDPSVTNIIPGVTSFTTSGAEMAGMSVQAIFSGGLDETLFWAPTGGDSGGVSGTAWGLSVSSGTTFDNNAWHFVNNTGQGLDMLVFDGQPGLTLFDRTLPAPGSLDSAGGKDFLDNTGADGTATYSQQVQIAANLPVGDLWHMLSVDFSSPITDIDWDFTQDTDNDIRISTQIPEPGIFTLFTLGLSGLGLVRLKK